MDSPTAPLTRRALEAAYRRTNRRAFALKDPVSLLYEHDDPADREIASLVASSLAYGRVAQIMKSAADALARLPRPLRALRDVSPASIRRAFRGFRHRFASGENMAGLLAAARDVLRKEGSLEAVFAGHFDPAHDTVLPALEGFTRRLGSSASPACGHLLPAGDRGSACKRINLMLRWLVRRDEVDPGGWTSIPPSKLIVPVDVHMHRVGLKLGLTRRASADMRAALEITRALARFCPEDPVRYDFALTRPGTLF